ncbi:unnamed protein product [Umbelopsis vinacea]|jgi:expansin (peptidoglycan-binding protein)
MKLSASFVVLALTAVATTLAAPVDKRSGHHHSKSSSKSSSGTFKGTGTWFIPATEGGSTGACGPHEGNNELIGALNAPQYGDMSSKSSWCGKKVKVTSGSKSVIVTINDACPECAHGSIDLTQAAFKKLGDLNTGVLGITWSLV